MKFWGVRGASIAIAVLACLALDRFAQGQNSYIQGLILKAGLFVTLAVSLNLINGITGQFSIGHAAFYQVGAYTTGYLAMTYFQKAHMAPGLWLLTMMIAGAFAASVAGLIVGLPSLRLRGDYLAIVTLGFGEIIRIVAQNQPKLGGSYGLAVAPQFQYIWITWLLAITCIAVCRNLLKSAHGLAFLAVREDEVASSAMGVNVTFVKVTAFLIGSAFAGAAGALYAHFLGFISPATFSMDVSFILVTMVVLGGTGSITGTAIAGAVLFYLPEKMRDLTDVRTSIVVGCAISIPLMVVTIRHVRDHYHGRRGKAGEMTAIDFAGWAVGALGIIGSVYAITRGVGVVGGIIGPSVIRLLLETLVWIVAVGLFLRHVFRRWTEIGLQKGLIMVGIVTLGLILVLAIGSLPFIKGTVPGPPLRMVIFAVTLIVLMLLRPQGILAHHEFSWSWVLKLFGVKAPTKEIAA